VEHLARGTVAIAEWLSPAVTLAVVRRSGLNSKMRLLREGESADEFYQRADAALYRAKAAGRDRLTE
jgi:GGDEF domain-containing protein